MKLYNGVGGLALVAVLLPLVTVTGGQASSEPKADRKSCQLLSDATFLEPARFPLTALASFQGSGNTWVRQILASSTGYKTGDIYSSYGNDIYPEFSSKHDETVLAIKTHNFNYYTCKRFRRALLIVRHPLDALYSEFNRLYGGNKTGYADTENLVNADGSNTWKWDMWMTHIGSWIDFYTYWLKEFKGKSHIIYYNNLKKDTVDELQAAIEFLELKPDHYRINCTLFYPKPAYFKRSHAKPPVEKYDLFKLSMSKADKAIRAFRKLVEDKFGLESRLYKKLNLEISEPKLQAQRPPDQGKPPQ